MSKYVDVDLIKAKVRRELIPETQGDGTVSVEVAERWFLKLLDEAPSAEEFSALKEDRDNLLRIAGNMHEWIFHNSYDEAEAYKECGLSDEDNARLGYGGSIWVELGGITDENMV